MNNMAKNLLLWLLIAAVLLSVFNNFNLRSATEQVGYSEFIREVQTDRLSKVLVDGLTITAQRKDGSSFETIRPMVEDPKLMDDLLAHNVTVEGKWDWAEWYTDTAPPKYLSKVLGFEVSHSEAGMNSDGMSRMDVVTLGANGKENYAKAKAVATGLLPVTA